MAEHTMKNTSELSPRLLENVTGRFHKNTKVGRTCVIDTGIGLRTLSDQLEISQNSITLAKIGFGTALVTNGLKEKIKIYSDYGVEVCFGGTLFEYFFYQNNLKAFRRILEDCSMTTVEISDGTINLDHSIKLALINEFSKDFRVISEVGSKDADAVVSPSKWVRDINLELDAGSEYVILEGRESGSAGLYRPSGEVRTGLLEEIEESGIPLSSTIFEAPTKTHQAFFMKRFGSDVNLANVALTDAISCEALRFGLRSDTFGIDAS